MKQTSGSVFSKGALIGMVGTAVLSFVLAFVLSIFGDDLSPVRSAGRDSFSVSAVGHALWLEFLRRNDVGTEIVRSGLPEGRGDDWPILLLEPNPALQVERTSEPFESLYLRSWEVDRTGPLVIAFPKWSSAPDPQNPQHVASVRIDLVDDLRQSLNLFLDDWELHKVALKYSEKHSDWDCTLLGEGSYRVSIKFARYFDPDTLTAAGEKSHWEPVVDCDGHPLILRTTDTSLYPAIYLIADADLFNNHGLGNADHAQLMLDLVTGPLGADQVFIDETIHGLGRTGSLFAELFRFPTVLVLLHGILVLCIFLWAGSVRFGSPRDEEVGLPDGRRMLIDNSARLLTEAGYAKDSLAVFYRQAILRVARHRFLSAQLDADEIVKHLQAESDARGMDIGLSALHAEIESLPAGRRKPTDKIVRLAERIHAWREEMTDGNRTHR